jgi:hypothetical protein
MVHGHPVKYRAKNLAGACHGFLRKFLELIVHCTAVLTFESISLQRRVRCEPDFLRLRGRPAPGITARRGSGENRISLRPRHRETSRISYGIKIGEVRIWSPTPAMIIVGVTASPPVM